MKLYERRTTLLKVLTRRRHCHIEELANELGVSPRTIRRDIVALSLHAPIYTTTGSQGGVFLMDSCERGTL